MGHGMAMGHKATIGLGHGTRGHIRMGHGAMRPRATAQRKRAFMSRKRMSLTFCDTMRGTAAIRKQDDLGKRRVRLQNDLRVKPGTICNTTRSTLQNDLRDAPRVKNRT